MCAMSPPSWACGPIPPRPTSCRNRPWGAGLRKMYPGDVEEYVSVVGTNAFMEFVESIQAEGVCWSASQWAKGTQAKTPLVVEIDKENVKKDIEALDIEIPVLTPRVYREYKNLSYLDVGRLGHQRVMYLQFSAEQQRRLCSRTSPPAR